MSAGVDSVAVAVVTVATVRVVTDAVTLVRARRVVLPAGSLPSCKFWAHLRFILPGIWFADVQPLAVADLVVAVAAVVRLPHLN